MHEEGAKLVVTDINELAVQKAVDDFNAESVEPDQIYDADCDIYSPCALGGTINDETIKKLKAKVIAGSANNQLLEDRHGDILHEKGIIYAPDYVINSGGVINVAAELKTYNEQNVLKQVEGIYQALEKVFAISKEQNIPTSLAADKLAVSRIKALQHSRKQFLPDNKHILN